MGLKRVALPAETPGVTHIVYPFGPKGDPDDGQEYLRCLEKRCSALADSPPFQRPVNMQLNSCKRLMLAHVWSECTRAVACVQGRLLPGALLVPPRQL